MTLSRAFQLIGFSLQIGGFIAVVMASTAELVRDYKDSVFFMRQVLRIRDFWLYWFGTLPQPVQLSASAGGSVGLRGSMTARKSPESDVERLDREIGELRAKVEHFIEDTEKRLTNTEQAVSALREDVTKRTDELQKRLDALRQGMLKKERRGALAFVAGTALLLAAVFV